MWITGSNPKFVEAAGRISWPGATRPRAPGSDGNTGIGLGEGANGGFGDNW
jgi:hypothetical protein